MTYVVEAEVPGRENTETIRVETREDVLKVTIRLRENGRTHVRILGDGRVYTPAEFALTIINYPAAHIHEQQ